MLIPESYYISLSSGTCLPFGENFGPSSQLLPPSTEHLKSCAWLGLHVYTCYSFQDLWFHKARPQKIINEFITTIGQIIIPIRSFLSLNRNCDCSALNLLAFSWILSVISPCSPKIDLVFFNMHPPSQPSIPYIGARKGTLIWSITNWSTVCGLWSTLSQT